MNDTNHDRGEPASKFAFGDRGAGEELDGLPENEVRKLRVGGKLAGTYVKFGHRSIIYHRGLLRQRWNDLLKASV